MAISAVHYQLLKEHAHLLPRGGSLLEIGEANWYGDIDHVTLIVDLINTATGDETRRIAADIRRACTVDLFEIAKSVYRCLFAPSVIEAVDINGTRSAMRQDLNGPLKLPRLYDVVINHGTAEHIFNIGMVFKSMHDAVKVGGVMIHESPFTGWIDHGFYCLQPTLFYDLAAVNEYELISLSIAHIESREIIRVESRDQLPTLTVPNNSLLFVVMRKTNTEPFRVPLQGYYDGRLSEKSKEAWHSRR